MTLSRKPLLVLLLAVGACTDTTRPAMGDVNSIIVVAADTLWAEVSDTVLTALEPRVFAVRDEFMFKLTHVSPGSEHWSELQRFRQILAIGRPGDPWMERPLDVADTTVSGGAILEARRVWARDQQVTVLVVPETAPAEYVRSAVDSLSTLLDNRYRSWARSRMYLSGHNTELADTLREEAGFHMDLPNVYRWRQLTESTYAFLNDNPDASKLVRWITVTWREPSGSQLTVDEALDWRDSLGTTFYDWGQTTLRDRLETRQIVGRAEGELGLEIRGAWTATEDFPQGGPFITRIIDCQAQDRRYLLDAWLYAPARDKYQYMIQLETLLNGFRCGTDGSA